MNYLEALTLRLAGGLAQLPPERLELHGAYLRSMQQADGGFAGREGGSDLYYTGFAVRGLALTGQLEGPTAERLVAFLRSRLTSHAPVVDLLSLIYAAALLSTATSVDLFADCDASWPTSVAAVLEDLRRDDGGYAKASEGAKSSTYHSFLVLLCQQLIDVPTPAADRLADFVRSQQREDGGFVEIEPMKRSGTNPTAAAMGALRILEQLEETTAPAVADFLAGMQNDEGGLRANTRIPIADLLSTFTGLLTLQDIGADNLIDTGAARRYVDSMACDDGGFHGAAWDDSKDVEYTFYGLGATALLASHPEA